MKKKSIIIIGILGTVSCSSKDPKTMANAYCECIQNNLQSGDIQECQDLAKAHFEILRNNPDQQQVYADELLNCTNVK